MRTESPTLVLSPCAPVGEWTCAASGGCLRYQRSVFVGDTQQGIVPPTMKTRPSCSLLTIRIFGLPVAVSLPSDDHGAGATNSLPVRHRGEALEHDVSASGVLVEEVHELGWVGQVDWVEVVPANEGLKLAWLFLRAEGHAVAMVSRYREVVTALAWLFAHLPVCADAPEVPYLCGVKMGW